MDFTGQAATFLTTLAMGVLLGGLFDFYRVLRGIFRPRSLVTYLCDFLYCLTAIALTFTVLLASNWGEIRFYVFIGILGGAVLYFQLLSRYAIWLLIRLIRAVLMIAGWFRLMVMKLFVQPIAYIGWVCSRPLVYTGRKAASVKRRLAGWYKAKHPPSDEDVPPPQ